MPKLTKRRNSAKKASQEAKNIPKHSKTQKIAKTIQSVKLIAKDRENRKRIFQIVDDIMNSRTTSIDCPHYLIGATSYQKLMTGVFNLERTHQHLLPKENTADFFWQVGEKRSEQSHYGDVTQALKIHPFIPFFCAKPDIYSPTHGFIVETKSTETIKELKKYDKVIPRTVLIQMILSMECFNVKEGRLYVHMFEGKHDGGKVRDFFQRYKYILTQTTPFIQNEDIPLIVERYLKYFKYYILEGGNYLTPRIEKEVKELFIRNIIIKKSAYDHHNGSNFGEIKIREEKVGEVCKKYGAQPKKYPNASTKGKIITDNGKDDNGYNRPYYNYLLWKEAFKTVDIKSFTFDDKQRVRINRSLSLSLEKRLIKYDDLDLLEGKDVNYSVMTNSLTGSMEEDFV